jgi:SAM-dependent methyltransferase
VGINRPEMVTQVTDKALLRRRLARAHAEKSAGADFLVAHVANELADRAGALDAPAGTALVYGAQSDRLPAALIDSGKAGRVVRFEQTSAALGGTAFPASVADEEALPLGPASVGLFVSVLALQWSNDLPGALIQARRALTPDGLFLAAMTGGATLAELREALFAAETELRGGASLRVLPAADLRDLGALLQRAGFLRPVVDREALTVRYDSALDLFRDLRAMGATNALSERERRSLGKRLLRRTAGIYAERFSDADGRVRATFEILYLTARAPPAVI